MSDRDREMKILSGMMELLIHTGLGLVELGAYCQTQKKDSNLSLETIEALDFLAQSTRRYVNEMDKMKDFVRHFVNSIEEEEESKDG